MASENRLRPFDSLLQWGHGRGGLQGILRRDQPPDLIQTQFLDRQLRQMNMTGMGRVKRASQYSNPQGFTLKPMNGV